LAEAHPLVEKTVTGPRLFSKPVTITRFKPQPKGLLIWTCNSRSSVLILNQDSKPRFQNYTITADPWERILDCLNRIKWEQDGTLGYRMSCGHGVCGSDAMKINGRCALACQKLVKDYEGTEVILEPLPAPIRSLRT